MPFKNMHSSKNRLALDLSRRRSSHRRLDLKNIRVGTLWPAYLAIGHLLCLQGSAALLTYDFSDPSYAAPVNGGIIATAASPLGSSGTGTFGGFLRVSDIASPMLEGISTDGALMPQVGDSQTSALPATALTPAMLVTIVGEVGNFYAFALDLNEPNSGDRFVSVDSVSIYAGTTATFSATDIDNFLGNSPTPTLIWSMDTLDVDQKTVVTDRTLLVNEDSSGSGTANLLFFIPQSLFAGVQTTDFLFIHYKEGVVATFTVPSGTHDYGNAGGFQEFGLMSGLTSITTLPPIVPPNFVPEGSTFGSLAVVGLGLGVLFGRSARRSRPGAPPRQP